MTRNCNGDLLATLFCSEFAVLNGGINRSIMYYNRCRPWSEIFSVFITFLNVGICNLIENLKIPEYKTIQRVQLAPTLKVIQIQLTRIIIGNHFVSAFIQTIRGRY